MSSSTDVLSGKMLTFQVTETVTYCKSLCGGLANVHNYCLFLCHGVIRKSATHSISLLHEVLPADVSHDAGGQSVSHHIHHGAESVSAGGVGKQNIQTKQTKKIGEHFGEYANLTSLPNCY